MPRLSRKIRHRGGNRKTRSFRQKGGVVFNNPHFRSKKLPASPPRKSGKSANKPGTAPHPTPAGHSSTFLPFRHHTPPHMSPVAHLPAMHPHSSAHHTTPIGASSPRHGQSMPPHSPPTGHSSTSHLSPPTHTEDQRQNAQKVQKILDKEKIEKAKLSYKHKMLTATLKKKKELSNKKATVAHSAITKETKTAEKEAAEKLQKKLSTGAKPENVTTAAHAEMKKISAGAKAKKMTVSAQHKKEHVEILEQKKNLDKKIKDDKRQVHANTTQKLTELHDAALDGSIIWTTEKGEKIPFREIVVGNDDLKILGTNKERTFNITSKFEKKNIKDIIVNMLSKSLIITIDQKKATHGKVTKEKIKKLQKKPISPT